MDKIIRLSLLPAVLLSIIPLSCKDTPNPVEKYGVTVVDKYKSTQEFGDRVSLQRLQQAVTTFRLTNGRFPEDLQELENYVGETLDANKYAYDPASGKITSN